MTTRTRVIWAGVGVWLLVAAGAARPGAARDPHPAAWNRRTAAAYLDARMTWWMAWPSAARDHGTFCISCHTAMPYALARPALRASGEGRTAIENRLLDNVTTRVRLWNEVAPFYPDQTKGVPKTSESRGTEAVLNALILAARDAQDGRLGDDTRAALQNMWALQMQTGDLAGAWIWLDFHNEPWEAPDSAYFGATLAALAAGMAPGGYAARADVQEGLNRLRAYLQRELPHQPLNNRLMLMWASAATRGLLTGTDRDAIVGAAAAAQHADGGWSASSLGPWNRHDGSREETASDGYGTGLATLALESAGLQSDDPRVARGLAWLRQHQDSAGQWHASSLNKERDPASDPARFMSDAATAYAVLALGRDDIRASVRK